MRSELRPPSPAPPPIQILIDVLLEVPTASSDQSTIQNENSIHIHNIEISNSVSVPDIHLLILYAFDKIVAPTITSPNRRHRFIKVCFSGTVLSNAIRQILVPLSTQLHQITINELNILTVHALMLSGIDI